LIDKDNDKLLDEVLDLLYSIPLTEPARVWAGSYADVADADIAIIAAGTRAVPGEQRLDSLSRNVSIIRETIRKLKAANFNGIVLMLTNPVDILAQAAPEESGFSVKKSSVRELF
jgi:L-lactate dehydrogenase